MARGALIGNTPAGVRPRAQIDALTASGAERFLFRMLTGQADCDVELRTLEYQTIGGAGEPTTASATLGVPTGPGAACNGPRPLLLYAHGTSADRNYSTLTSTEGFGGVLLAAFAARGFLVVAPDYTGYARSALPYHPYLNAESQAADMIDALRAARGVLAAVTHVREQALFIAGFSQGGHVAMATQKVMERDHAAEFDIAGTAPMSGPFALEYTMLRIFGGDVSDGANLILPLLVDGYQRSYGNLFADPAEYFAAPYERSALGQFPGTRSPAELVASGVLPARLLAAQGSPYLLNPALVSAVLSDPQQPLRRAAADNSLLDWTPRAPMAFCGGARDPVVFYANTNFAQTALAARGARITRYNFDDRTTIPGGSLSEAYLKFRTLFLFDQNLESYHVALAPFCARLARDFFASLLQ